jgi:hypothetical protein
MKKQKNITYFSSSNFYLTAFLIAKGMILTEVDKTDPRRAQFVLVDAPEREALLDSFNFGGKEDQIASVDARDFIAAIKTLKDKLYQDNSST